MWPISLFKADSLHYWDSVILSTLPTDKTISTLWQERKSQCDVWGWTSLGLGLASTVWTLYNKSATPLSRSATAVLSVAALLFSAVVKAASYKIETVLKTVDELKNRVTGWDGQTLLYLDSDSEYRLNKCLNQEEKRQFFVKCLTKMWDSTYYCHVYFLEIKDLFRGLYPTDYRLANQKFDQLTQPLILNFSWVQELQVVPFNPEIKAKLREPFILSYADSLSSSTPPSKEEAKLDYIDRVVIETVKSSLLNRFSDAYLGVSSLSTAQKNLNDHLKHLEGLRDTNVLTKALKTISHNDIIEVVIKKLKAKVLDDGLRFYVQNLNRLPENDRSRFVFNLEEVEQLFTKSYNGLFSSHTKAQEKQFIDHLQIIMPTLTPEEISRAKNETNLLPPSVNITDQIKKLERFFPTINASNPLLELDKGKIFAKSLVNKSTAGKVFNEISFEATKSALIERILATRKSRIDDSHLLKLSQLEQELSKTENDPDQALFKNVIEKCRKLKN